MQKNAYNQFIEDTIRNMIDIMVVSYGTREVRMKTEEGYKYRLVDFSLLRDMNYSLSIDIGSSSPYDENARLSTLGNLWDREIVQEAGIFVESIPDKLLPNKEEILNAIKEREELMLAQQTAQMNINNLAMQQEQMNQALMQSQG